eukprot:m.378828 g.378828  ORF g.378828 m.378828 type:complete len:116 (-) comp20938_c0_seq7:474-821(-)
MNIQMNGSSTSTGICEQVRCNLHVHRQVVRSCRCTVRQDSVQVRFDCWKNRPTNFHVTTNALLHDNKFLLGQAAQQATKEIAIDVASWFPLCSWNRVSQHLGVKKKEPLHVLSIR